MFLSCTYIGNTKYKTTIYMECDRSITTDDSKPHFQDVRTSVQVIISSKTHNGREETGGEGGREGRRGWGEKQGERRERKGGEKQGKGMRGGGGMERRKKQGEGGSREWRQL